MRDGLAEERWRDGGERHRPDKSGTKDKGKRRAEDRNQKTIRRKGGEKGLGSSTGRGRFRRADY